jgi:hypothetical protein
MAGLAGVYIAAADPRPADAPYPSADAVLDHVHG